MRITNCHIDSFGTFEHRKLDDLNHRLVVILGPNEAGKSTFFHFLTTMLFGFSPADASNHPYARVGHALGGRMCFEAGDTVCTLERGLKGTPRGRLEVGLDGLFGRTEKLRNRPLPGLTIMSREVFESVYALTLADMVALEGKSWETVQDRLLGGLNIEQIRNPRQVVAALETEAKKLWRSDRRGKTRSAKIREEVRVVTSKVRDARGRDRLERTLYDEIQDLTSAKVELQEQLKKDRIAIRTTDRLLPVKFGLEKIANLKAEAGDIHRFDDLPADPAEKLSQLRATRDELEGELERMEVSARRLACAVDAFDEGARKTVAAGTDIRSLQSQRGLMSRHKSDLRELSVRLERCQARFNETLLDTFGECGSETIDALGRVPLGEVRAAFAELVLVRQRLERVRAREEGAQLNSKPKGILPWATLAVLGAAVVGTGIVIDEPAVWGPACVAVSAGIALLIQSLSTRSSKSESASSSEPVADLEKEREATLDELSTLLHPIGVPRVRWEAGGEQLIGCIQELKNLVKETNEIRGAAAELQQRIDDNEARTKTVARDVGIRNGVGGDELVEELARSLVIAEALCASATLARAQVQTEQERIETAKGKLERTVAELTALESALAPIGQGDADKGSAIINNRRFLARRATGVREDLEIRFPDLDELVKEISGLNGSARLTDEARIQLEQRIEVTGEKIRTLGEEIARKETQIDALRDQPSVADLESELQLLEDQNDRICRERDRLTLLSAFIRHADQSFREKHQPDVVKRASRIISALTSGRYDRLEVTDNGDGHLMVHDYTSDQLLPVRSPLSRGTLDQIYLALRLAIAEHLDDPGDPLPLFLDEVLVNWDSSRRANAHGLLRDLSGSRQIFFFTCHEWLAGELMKQAAGHVVEI